MECLAHCNLFAPARFLRSTAWLQNNVSLLLTCSLICSFTDSFQRTLGLRFLYPVYYIPEVEITPSTKTSGEVIEKGKTTWLYVFVTYLCLFAVIVDDSLHVLITSFVQSGCCWSAWERRCSSGQVITHSSLVKQKEKPENMVLQHWI